MGGATVLDTVVDGASRGFNAARGFVGGATNIETKIFLVLSLFQCRTRLCGWCSFKEALVMDLVSGFNAARGFVGGAACI